ncbi:MAG TPA: cyclic nucleotide-binding domain-containing protein [Verrucomicrobiae bacterium]
MNSPETGVGFKIWAADDVVYGPVELPTLVEWIRDERVEANTWVYSEQTDTWSKASNVPDLGMFFRGRAVGTARAVSADGPTPLVQGIRPGMLRRVKILAEMNDQQLGRFVQFMEVKQVRQFNDVVKQGEHGDAMFLILEGEVRVRLMIAQKETTLTTLSAGEFFGEMTLFDQGPRSADVVANNESTLLKISHSAFVKLIADAPDLATPFLLGICRTLTARMRADNKRYRDTINFARASANK